MPKLYRVAAISALVVATLPAASASAGSLGPLMDQAIADIAAQERLPEAIVARGLQQQDGIAKLEAVSELIKNLGVDQGQVRFNWAEARWQVALPIEERSARTDRALATARQASTQVSLVVPRVTKDELARRLTAIAEEATVPYGASVDYFDGRIQVFVAPADAAHAAEIDAIPGVDVDATAQTTQACATNAVGIQALCNRPIRGGIELVSSERSICTLGFIAYVPGQTGQRRALTAGHCNVEGPVGVTWSATTASPTTTATIGTQRIRNFGGDAGDSASIQIGTGTGGSTDASYWRAIDPQPWINYGGSTDRAVVTGSIAPPGQGVAVCKFGRRTGTTCGTVLRVDIPITYDWTDSNGVLRSTTVNGMSRSSACSRRGDSGGPVFVPGSTGVVAVGLISGGPQDPPATCQASGEFSNYEPIGRALTRTNTALLTQ